MYDQPVIQLDILPTALAAAQVEIPIRCKLDGVNLLPYLSGENAEPPHDALYWRFGQQMAIRQGDWKLVRYDPRVDGMTGRATESKLYNLADDIGESNDLWTRSLRRQPRCRPHGTSGTNRTFARCGAMVAANNATPTAGRNRIRSHENQKG